MRITECPVCPCIWMMDKHMSLHIKMHYLQMSHHKMTAADYDQRRRVSCQN